MKTSVKAAVEYGLQGQFKVDIYNQSGELVDTTDYFSNFITQTGLSYPYTYNFPDCFRFLTLGVGMSANTMDTTGIEVTSVIAAKNVNTNLSEYQTLGYLHDPHLDKKSDASAGSCGTRIGSDGPAMYRGWVLPTGDDNYMAHTVAINEFMVSPSSGQDPTGRYAFSRVQRSVTLPSGTKTIVTYMLNVKIQNTGIKSFESGTFNTGQAEISEQENLVESFGSLSGYYRQVYHGIRCVDNQGRTFIPKYGDPMEPSNVRLDQLSLYFSPDNSQFDSNVKGGAALNVASSYATDGLYALSFNHDLDVNANVPDDQVYFNAKLPVSNEPQNDSTSPFKLIRDIRLKPESSSYRPPRLSDYMKTTTQSVDLSEANYDYLIDGTNGETAVSMASFGMEELRPNEFDKGFVASFSSMMSNLGVQAQDITGRRRKLTRKGFITPINALGHNTRFGSLVYAFRNGSYYYPAVDCMFYDSSGRSVMQHYREFSGVVFSERGKGIIDATLSTEPRTYGGFHVKSVNGPIVFNSATNLSTITGFSGFYEKTQIEVENEWGGTSLEWIDPVAVRAYDTLPTAKDTPGKQNLPIPCSDANYTDQEACEGAGKTWAPYLVHGYTGEDGLGGGQGYVQVGNSSYYGVGAVQGYLTPALDYGIVDHHLDAVDGSKSILTEPAINDPMYWPNVLGKEIDFAVRDLKYFHTGLGVVPDSNGYFTKTANSTATCKDGTSASEELCCTNNGGAWNNSTNICTNGDANSIWSNHGQVVADLTFQPMLSGNKVTFDSCVDDPNNPIPDNWLPLTSITQNRWSITCQGGFLLSNVTGDSINGDYDGDPNYWLEGEAPSTATNALVSGVRDMVTGAGASDSAGSVQAGFITGYLIPIAQKDKIVNTSWRGTKTEWDNLTTKVQFPVNIKQQDVYFGPQNTNFLYNVATVEKFFDGFGDNGVRGSNMTSRLSGQGLDALDGGEYMPVFTGFAREHCDDTAGSATEALCCTNNNGTWANNACTNGTATWKSDGLFLLATEFNFNNAAYDIRPTAILDGKIEMSDFIPPEGDFVHYESQRLLPNFATGQATSDAYPREGIKQGGVYPGMSSLNTMEVYLDITWSAPCAGVADCTEQPA